MLGEAQIAVVVPLAGMHRRGDEPVVLLFELLDAEDGLGAAALRDRVLRDNAVFDPLPRDLLTNLAQMVVFARFQCESRSHRGIASFQSVQHHRVLTYWRRCENLTRLLTLERVDVREVACKLVRVDHFVLELVLQAHRRGPFLNDVQGALALLNTLQTMFVR